MNCCKSKTLHDWTLFDVHYTWCTLFDVYLIFEYYLIYVTWFNIIWLRPRFVGMKILWNFLLDNSNELFLIVKVPTIKAAWPIDLWPSKTITIAFHRLIYLVSQCLASQQAQITYSNCLQYSIQMITLYNPRGIHYR